MDNRTQAKTESVNCEPQGGEESLEVQKSEINADKNNT